MKIEDGGSSGVMPLKMKDTEDHQELLRAGREAKVDRSSLRACRRNSLCSDLDLYFWPLEPRGNTEKAVVLPPACLRSFLAAVPRKRTHCL